MSLDAPTAHKEAGVRTRRDDFGLVCACGWETQRHPLMLDAMRELQQHINNSEGDE